MNVLGRSRSASVKCWPGEECGVVRAAGPRDEDGQQEDDDAGPAAALLLPLQPGPALASQLQVDRGAGVKSGILKELQVGQPGRAGELRGGGGVGAGAAGPGGAQLQRARLPPPGLHRAPRRARRHHGVSAAPLHKHCLFSFCVSMERMRAVLESLLVRMEEYATSLESLVQQRTEQYWQEKRKTEDLLYELLPK